MPVSDLADELATLGVRFDKAARTSAAALPGAVLEAMSDAGKAAFERRKELRAVLRGLPKWVNARPISRRRLKGRDAAIVSAFVDYWWHLVVLLARRSPVVVALPDCDIPHVKPSTRFNTLFQRVAGDIGLGDRRREKLWRQIARSSETACEGIHELIPQPFGNPFDTGPEVNAQHLENPLRHVAERLAGLGESRTDPAPAEVVNAMDKLGRLAFEALPTLRDRVLGIPERFQELPIRVRHASAATRKLYDPHVEEWPTYCWRLVAWVASRSPSSVRMPRFNIGGVESNSPFEELVDRAIQFTPKARRASCWRELARASADVCEVLTAAVAGDEQAIAAMAPSAAAAIASPALSPPAAGPPRKEARWSRKHRATREQNKRRISTAGNELVADRGIFGFSAKELAERAKVPESTVKGSKYWKDVVMSARKAQGKQRPRSRKPSTLRQLRDDDAPDNARLGELCGDTDEPSDDE